MVLDLMSCYIPLVTYTESATEMPGFPLMELRLLPVVNKAAWGWVVWLPALSKCVQHMLMFA